MSCSSCNKGKFVAEMVIHFNTLKDVDRPAVSAFPKIVVCLNCGASRFNTPVKELWLLRGATA
jgi:hypothetical protein